MGSRKQTDADLESKFQHHLIERLKGMFPGCYITKQDANILQGIPDLLILHEGKWVMLEVKAHRDAAMQPNQPYWVDHFDRMGFAAFIYPENEEEVLREVQQTLRTTRRSRISQRL